MAVRNSDEARAASVVDLQQFTANLRNTHAQLTQSFLEQQEAAEAAWARYEQIKHQLQQFRKDFGHVLRALDSREASEAQAAAAQNVSELQTITADDVATVDASILEGDRS